IRYPSTSFFRSYLNFQRKVGLAFDIPQFYLNFKRKVGLAFDIPQFYLNFKRKVGLAFDIPQFYLNFKRKVGLASCNSFPIGKNVFQKLNEEGNTWVKIIQFDDYAQI